MFIFFSEALSLLIQAGSSLYTKNLLSPFGGGLTSVELLMLRVMETVASDVLPWPLEGLKMTGGLLGRRCLRWSTTFLSLSLPGCWEIFVN